MPLLHRTGDIDRCLYSTEDFNVNCVMFTIIKPDNTSKLWHQIEDYSNDYKKHYRHDFVHSAICLKECEEQLSNLSESERDDLFVEEFPWITGQKWYDDGTKFQNTTVYRELYGRKMNQCVNLWLKENYNLTGTSMIYFCNTNRDAEVVVYDHWHYMFLSLTFLILIVVFMASIWDASRNKNSTLTHYKTPIKDLSTGKNCLICFSLIRNWFRLTDIPKTKLAKDLRFTHAIRYISTFIFVLAHQLLAYTMTPSVNPEFVEQSYENPNTVSLHNNTTIQTFFLLSGFLLYININQIFKKNQFNLKFVGIAILYRYIRLTPVLIIFILFDASFLYDGGAGSGGYWKFWTEVEKTLCRRNWWANLLYINNYVNVDEICLVHTWYISADTQIFVISLVLFMFMWRYPKIRNILFGLTLFVSWVIQFVVNYVNGFDPMYMWTPETKRALYYNMPEAYKKDFAAAHMYLSNYLTGIGCGMLYTYIRKNDIDLTKFRWFKPLWYCNFLIGHITLVGGSYLFYNYYFEKSIWLSLVSVFMKNIWCFISIIFFLAGAKRFLNWHIFTPLGRLTYSIYISHLSLMRFMFGSGKTLIGFMLPMMFIETIGIFVIANIAAVILCLCVEFPLTALANILLKRQRAAPVNENEENSKNVEMIEIKEENEKFLSNQNDK
uniref:CSON009735 protein n=1 Tax=Culicoides sonorensis TaxID=179676 RepID=A0A336LJU7_CULSO